MLINSILVIWMGKFVYWFLYIFCGGGSLFFGKLVLKFDLMILKYFVKNYDVIVIIGINGKMLMIVLMVKVLCEQYFDILINLSGFNMK